MKKIICIILLCCIGNQLYCQKSTTPCRLVETNETEINVTYTFYDALIQDDPLYIGAKFYKINGFGLNDVAGEPSIPFRTDIFTIPTGASFEVNIVECQYTDTIVELAPARPPLVDSHESRYSLSNVPPISMPQGFYPTNVIGLIDRQTYSNKDILRLRICPLQYDCFQKKLRLYSKLKYKITYNATKQMCDKGENTRKSVARFFQNTCLNNDNLQIPDSKSNSSFVPDNQYYLIVTTNKYLTAVNKFAEWKRIKGQRVIIESSDSWSSASAVKNAIVNRYQAVNDSIDYLLIVGDIDDVPSFSSTVVNNHVTDLYYGCINSSTIPEIRRGRISVNTSSEASNVFDKIIKYEKEPWDDVNYYSKGVHIANFEPETDYITEHLRFTLTSEEIRNYMISKGKNIERIYHALSNVIPTYWNNSWYSYGGSVPSELMKPTFSWNGSSGDISQSINDGCFYLLKNGHGTVYTWQTPYYQNYNVNTFLQNDKYPVIFSMSCLTGKFNDSTTCLAEAFQRKQNGGSVGMFAASEESYPGYNDILAECMFDAIWPDTVLRVKMPMASDTRPNLGNPVYELGDILDFGLSYMDEVCLGVGSLFPLLHREVYHCFGDPSMMLYTNKPSEFYNPTVTYSNGKLTVNSHCLNSRITFYTPSSTNPIVDSYIGNIVEYQTSADSVIICIDKHNYIPYIHTFHNTSYIQNTTINGNHTFVGSNVLMGNHVNTSLPTGDVNIDNATVTIKGNSVTLHPGTNINNANVKINE